MWDYYNGLIKIPLPAALCKQDRKCPQRETFLSLSGNQRNKGTLVNLIAIVTVMAGITIEP
jgi:hypothetical protein